jgi:hypothetical protein
VEENPMYVEFILGIGLFTLILASLPTKSNVSLENVDCILNEKLKDKKFKKLYDKECKKLQKTEDKMKKKLLVEGYKELAKPEEVTKSYTSVDEMLEDLHSHRGWTLWDYIVSFWHRYFWNFVSDIPLRVKTFIQRGQRGWADSDTWDYSYYMAKLFSEGIQHMLKHGNTCFTKKDLKALKHIIETFKTAKSIEEHDLIYFSSELFTWAKYKKAKRTCVYMNKKRSYPRDRKYRVMTLREVQRFEKGFDLLKKYYFYLWD